MKRDNYIVSARKYRPSSFAMVVGQQALTTTLKNAIAMRKLAHAYLFCGPRGVGKTTCARIFAKTINCLAPLPDGEACNECESCLAFNEQRSFNVYELDAASNNSVDDIRQLVEQVRIPPQIGKYKVYIIDEVHMLSTSAFNAFLKTLEEPPQHAIFILATTEKHKIIPTIISRCQVYDFNRIGVDDTVEYLTYVAAQEGISAEQEALNVIALKADGGMRDALSIFDQVVSFTNGHITYQRVIENLNVLDYEYYFSLTDYCVDGKVTDALLLFNDVLNKGFDGNHFITGLASHFRDLLVSKDEVTLPLLKVGSTIRERYKEQTRKCSLPFLYKALKLCNDCDLNYRVSKNKRLLVELTLIQLAQLTSDQEDDPSSGRGPKAALKPIKPNSSTEGIQPAPLHSTLVSSPSGTSVENQGTPLKTTADKLGVKPRTAGSSAKSAGPGLSIKSLLSSSPDSVTSDSKKVSGIPSEADNADFTEADLNRYWQQYANNLPHERVALSKRMRLLHPVLIPNTAAFEVVVDNEVAKKDFVELIPQVQDYLRAQLKHGKITMRVRVSAPMENTRALSRGERFTQMSAKNPALLRLKEKFVLELE